MNYKNIILVVGVFLFGVILGISASSMFVSDNKNTNTEQEALKQAVREQYPEYFEDSDFGTYYSGVVEEVKNNSIVFKIDLPEIILLASDIKEIREISIDENTKIVKNIEKDEAQYQKELAKYNIDYAKYQREIDAQPADGSAEISFGIIEPFYPDFTIQKEITLKDIKVGDLIIVSTQQDGLAENESATVTTSTLIVIQENIDELFDEAALDIEDEPVNITQ